MNYTKPPLPLLGNKRNFRKAFLEALDEFDPNGTYLDVFGGSGLLSHWIKQKYPNAKVIWNDFDNYQKRLDSIDTTNEIISRLSFLDTYTRKQRISSTDKEKALEIIKEYENADFISLSSYLFYAGKYAHSFEELKKQPFYFARGEKVKKKDGYLDGVIRISKDYTEALKEHKGAILVCDPPYLNTDIGGYKDVTWNLVSFLKLIELLQEPFIFFSSKKSEALSFFEYAKARDTRFQNLKIVSRTCYSGFKKRDDDYMIIKAKDE